jgi:hypothetical protein
MKIRYKVPAGVLRLNERSDLASVKKAIENWMWFNRQSGVQTELPYERPQFLINGVAPKEMDSHGHVTATDLQSMLEILRQRFRLLMLLRKQSNTRVMFFTFSTRGAKQIEYAMKEALYSSALDAKCLDEFDFLLFKVLFFSIRPIRIVFDLSEYTVGVLMPTVVKTKLNAKQEEVNVVRIYRPSFNERTGVVTIDARYHNEEAEEFHDTIMTRWDTR